MQATDMLWLRKASGNSNFNSSFVPKDSFEPTQIFEIDSTASTSRVVSFIFYAIRKQSPVQMLKNSDLSLDNNKEGIL